MTIYVGTRVFSSTSTGARGVTRDRGHLTLHVRCWTQHHSAEQPGSGRMGACWAPCSWLSHGLPVALGQGGGTQRELSSYG